MDKTELQKQSEVSGQPAGLTGRTGPHDTADPTESDLTLPDLHQQALLIKNRKRLQHDGGRAWIADGQLHNAVQGANHRIEHGIPSADRQRGTDRDVLERRAGDLISRTNSFRRL